MAQRLVLFAGYILTMDRPQPLEDGFVLIEGPRILQVGRRKELYFRPARMLDLGATVLLPGLINAHCHLDFTSFKGRVRFRGGFRDWLRRMGARTRETTPAEFRKSVQKGIRESLAFGTTTLCDVSTSLEGWALLRQSPLRSFVFPELIDLAQSSPKDYWRRFQEKLKALLHQAPPTATFRWGLGPHTPFTVSKELLLLAGRYLAEHRQVPTTMHLSESREEARFFRTGRGPIAQRIKALNPDWNLPRRTTAVQYLNAFGWLPKLDLGVHLNLVDGKDVALLSKNRVSVAHCPGSHDFFGHPPFPYRRLRRARVTVCLGTDSLASNRSLSLFREMRLFQKAHPEVPAQEVLSLATVKGAQALGMGAELGQIRPGFLADLVGIPVPRGPRNRDLTQQVIRHRGAVSFSMIHGEPRLRLT